MGRESRRKPLPKSVVEPKPTAPPPTEKQQVLQTLEGLANVAFSAPAPRNTHIACEQAKAFIEKYIQEH